MDSTTDDTGGQLLFACDEHGRPTGEHVVRATAHIGDGQRHLAVVVILRNGRGEILLQRRKHRLFDDLWDLAGATHPLHLAGGRDESFEQAGRRCLRDEYGIEGTPLRLEGGFTYFARDGEYCENEYCAILVGDHDGPVAVRPSAGYECRWVAPAALREEIRAGAKRFAPWALVAVERLAARGVLAT
jgi:isopentenyldiphosphate isomerase